MENQHPRRLQQAIIPRSQRLLNCQSVSTAGSSLQDMRTNSSNSALKSATKSRSGFKREENDQNPLSNKKTQKKTEEITDAAAGFVRFLPPSKSKTEVPRRTRSASTSPSAWALSPGRSFPLPVPKAPSLETLKQDLKKGEGGGVGGGGVSAVLKFFRQKKGKE
ncbi:QWRF motif-containing protein 7 [Forsythia ovata]|uniref:QWRF motif-containing protein 7 n=1 Tax=Forsythia ovata TaxID=205694 RepID=A0ABD1RN91_9LAMI